jgi:heterodisulfide reductase subunit A
VKTKVGAVLIVGAGVGGIRAALDLAESGFRVYLIDKSPSIGGTISQMDEWFPDNQCELCKLLPAFSRDECSQFCLRRDISHPNIEFIPCAKMEKIEGEAGNFEVSIRIESRLVQPTKCIGCGLCVDACPIEITDEFNEGLQKCKAVYTSNPQIIPNVYTIDREHCTKCEKCVAVCPTDAIDLLLPDEVRKLAVGAVIVATGFGEYNAVQMGQYGYGRYSNVLTNIQMERLLSSSGYSRGKLVRPFDGKVPQKVAFLQCIGSRDMKRNYCSSACCMYALKEAMLIKEQSPETEVTVFYMDMRAFGKGYHRYYLKAIDLGINFVRCRVSTLRENPKTRNLMVLARAEDGSSINCEFDMIILSVGQCPSVYLDELRQVLGVSVNDWGFIQSQDFWGVKTDKDGIYTCGSALAPADISDTVVQASAAACQASILLSSERNQLVGKKVKLMEASLDEAIKVAIFVCHCGEEVASVVDIEKVTTFALKLPGVVKVESIPYLCMPETLDKVKQSIAASGVNRVIFAACAPYHYRKLFEETMQEIGIDPSLWQLVNFREQVAWVHQEDKSLATEKAQRLLAVAVEQIRGQELLSVPSTLVNQQGMVIGGGISGIIAALCLAEQGFDVHLIESSTVLGGHTRDVFYSLGNDSPQTFLSDIYERIEANDRIHLHLETEVTEISGHAGNFRTKIKTKEEIIEIEHGTLIIATGAHDYQPTEYFYGHDERVITQKELQGRLVSDALGQPSVVVMIQCVGSRDNDRPYCSRSCCSEAIVNALKVKEQSPETQVIILYQDIMTYGFKEKHYTQAREAGILFVRYELDSKPEVIIEDKAITVKAAEPLLHGRIEIEAELLVLTTGIVPRDNKKLAEILSQELTDDGFFKEVDTKFCPVDSVISGIFVCGLANAPVCLDEEVVQAQAVAQRAATLLAKERLESGRIISEVNARKCTGCGLCVTTCPYNARELDEGQKVAVVEEVMCQGCGICVALCPNGAAKLRGLKEKQLFSMIEAAL